MCVDETHTEPDERTALLEEAYQEVTAALSEGFIEIEVKTILEEILREIPEADVGTLVEHTMNRLSAIEELGEPEWAATDTPAPADELANDPGTRLIPGEPIPETPEPQPKPEQPAPVPEPKPEPPRYAGKIMTPAKVPSEYIKRTGGADMDKINAALNAQPKLRIPGVIKVERPVAKADE